MSGEVGRAAAKAGEEEAGEGAAIGERGKVAEEEGGDKEEEDDDADCCNENSLG